MGTLRDYQQTALDQLRQALGVHRRVIVQMPTGGGKTRVAAEIVNGALSKKKRIIFEVPAISLVDQTLEMFADEGITSVGVIQANHHLTDWSKPVQIASVQTLQKRDEIPRADIVIRDEAHKLFKFDVRWMTMDEWRVIPFVGLSATPWTRGLGRLYQQLIIGTTTKELIEKKWLVPFRVFMPMLRPDLSGVRTVAGDYHQDELSKVMNKSKLTADAVQTWQQKAEGPTICFAVDRAHARALQEQFELAGVPSAYMDAMTSLPERKVIQRRLESGEIKVVCNVDVIGIGVDWPLVSCISYCRPTKSEMRYVQNIGRGLRVMDGKIDLLVLDHSTTTAKLGFVTDITHTILNDGKEAVSSSRNFKLPRECDACGYLMSYGALICSNCGKEHKPLVRMIEAAEGELQQAVGKATAFTMAQKIRFFAELKGYAQERGFKPGWAANAYREKFGVWPDWSIKNVAPAVAGAPLRMWIKSRLIKYAKGKARSVETAVRHEIDDLGTKYATARKDEPRHVPGTLMTEQDMEEFR